MIYDWHFPCFDGFISEDNFTFLWQRSSELGLFKRTRVKIAFISKLCRCQPSAFTVVLYLLIIYKSREIFFSLSKMKCFVPLYILLGSMLMHVGNAKSASQSCSCVNGVCNCEQQEDQYGNMAGAASMAQTGFGRGPSTYNSAATGNSDTNVINSQSSRTGNADFGDYNPLINGMPGFGNLFGTPFGGVPTGPYGGVPGGPSGGVPGGPSGGVSTGSFSGVSVGPNGAFAGGPFGAVAGGPFGAVAGGPFGVFAGGAIAGFGGFPNTGTFAFAGKKK